VAAADDGDRSQRQGRIAPYALLTPGMLWLLLFFLVPLVTLARTSLSVKESRFAVDATFTWEFSNYTDAISDYSEQFARSFLYAGAATLICIAIGYPVAYVIAFRGGRFKNVLLGLVVVPFFTSFLIRTLAWATVLSDSGPVLSLLDSLSLVGVLESLGIAENGGLLSTHAAVIGGLAYNFLPFMILPIYVSLEKIDLRLTEAAKDLYNNGWQAFRKVVLPLSLPGVFAGTLLTFIPAAGDYVNVQFLGTPNSAMIGTVIQSRFLTVLDYPTAAALSFCLMVSVLAIVVVYVRRVGARELL
jgi:spermidine/putrescine transport system permease protein